MINLRFPHCGIASLAQVSTMGLCPLLEITLVVKNMNRKEHKIPEENSSNRSFTSLQMSHTHTFKIFNPCLTLTEKTKKQETYQAGKKNDGEKS